MALDELMKLKGIQVAVEFDAQGKLIEISGDMSNELANLLARFSHLTMQVAKSQAEDYTVMGGVGIEHPTGFGFIGTKRSSFTRGNKGVLLLSEEADFNEIIKNSW